MRMTVFLAFLVESVAQVNSERASNKVAADFKVAFIYYMDNFVYVMAIFT